MQHCNPHGLLRAFTNFSRVWKRGMCVYGLALVTPYTRELRDFNEPSIPARSVPSLRLGHYHAEPWESHSSLNGGRLDAGRGNYAI